MMQPIMIIADLENKTQIALKRGLALAKTLNTTAEVIGFCCEALTAFSAPVTKQIKAKLLAEKQMWLDAEVKKQAPAGMNVKTRVIWGKRVHEWVVKRCDKQN